MMTLLLVSLILSMMVYIGLKFFSAPSPNWGMAFKSRSQTFHTNVIFAYTVDSRYLDPSYLDPITYVELISKSRLFSLCIYCISASRMSNYFYVDTLAISSIIFSP